MPHQDVHRDPRNGGGPPLMVDPQDMYRGLPSMINPVPHSNTPVQTHSQASFKRYAGDYSNGVGIGGGLSHYSQGYESHTPVGGSALVQREPNFLPSLIEEKSMEVPSIKNVWFDNFEEELPIISELLEKYPYISMVRQNWLILKTRIQNSPGS